ncbi:MAG TPA: hypothetical protein VFB72_14160 [Verrucomicrobiae bacterium]|nr:hypothetical protein [Verrucomicrobiae bacterium]
MARKGKWFFALALITVLAAFAFFVLSHSDNRAVSGERLPDGSTLRLATAQFTNGNFLYSATGGYSGWRGTIARVLPKNLVAKLGWLQMSGTIGFGAGGKGANLCVFTIHEGSALKMKYQDMRMVISDESGNAFDVGYPMGVMSTSDMLNQLRLEGWCPPAFPRRGKKLDLRFFERGKSNAPCLAEFIISNPAPGNYPVWTPEALPAIKTNDDLTVTMVSLKSGLSKAHQTRAAATNEVAVTLAALRILQSGNSSNSWRPKAVEISDATGNSWIPFANVLSERHKDGLDYFSFEGALWPGEAAWKLRFEFSRIADYQPNEVFTFSGITVPGATQVINLDSTTNIAGSILRLVAITGEKAEQPGNLKWSTVKNRVNISIRATPFPTGYRLNLLKVTDETGREAKIKREPDWNPPERVYGFKTPEGAKQLSFTFALHKSRYVEFMARPEFARSNN